MLTLSVETDEGSARNLRIERFPARIGRRPDSAVHLPGWRVARVHAEIVRIEQGFKLVDRGSLGGTWVNGERIAEYAPLAEDDEIEIAGYRVRVHRAGEDAAHIQHGDAHRADADPADAHGIRAHGREAQRTSTLVPSDGLVPWRRLLHRRLLATIDLRRQDIRQLSAEQLHDEIFVERNGRLEAAGASFTGEDAVRAAIDRIVAPLGRRIDESSPMVDARLPDGSRVNAVIPPLAVRGPAITIRRFNRRLFSPADLVANGSLSQPMLDFLAVCVRSRRNVVVSGGTGSGKTTLLNLLSNLIEPGQRVVTIEDAAELRLAHAHRVTLEARPANAEGRGLVSIRDLVRNALRMRPDRIVVGECRGGEALDVLQAMNTGRDGSLATVHASSPRDVISRLETMVLMAEVDMPVAAIREQIVGAIDIVVHQARMADGRRRVVEIVELTGLEGARVLMQPLFRWAAGRFGGCGNVPQFYERLREEGEPLDLSIFRAEGS